MRLTILKKIKVAKPVPESLAFIGFENSISTSKIDLIKYNFTVYRRFHGFTLPLSLLSHGGVFIYAISYKTIISRKLKHRFKLVSICLACFFLKYL
jgi:hypothetical protein